MNNKSMLCSICFPTFGAGSNVIRKKIYEKRKPLIDFQQQLELEDECLKAEQPYGAVRQVES